MAQKSRLLMFLGLVALVFNFGCSSNPASSGADCDHFDADGVVLRANGQVVVQWEGSVSGDLEVGHGSTVTVDVSFLLADSTEALPEAACSHSMVVEVTDSETASVEDGETDWSFKITGVEDGETSVRVRISHGDHFDFTSKYFEVHVHDEEETEIEGFRLKQAGNVLVSQYEGVLTGDLEIEPSELSEPMTVVFLGHEEVELDPKEIEEGSALDFTVGDDTLITVVPDATDPWTFQLQAAGEGETTLGFSLLHKGHSDFDSQPIPVEIHEHEETEIEGFRLKQAGNVLVSQYEGVLTGDLEIEPSELSEPMTVVFLGHEEVELDPSEIEEGSALEFTVGDDALITVVPDGTDPWTFQLQAGSEGETTLSFSLLHKGHSDFDSQPIPIEVHEHGEVEIEGFRLKDAGNVLVSQYEGALTGSIALDASQLSASLTVVFLGHEEVELDPSEIEEGAALEFTIGDEGVVTVVPDGSDPWTFQLQAGTAGSTTLAFSLLHKGHSDFDSQAIPIEVTSAEIMPEAMGVYEGCSQLATYAYDPSRGPTASTGTILVATGESRRLTVRWYGEYDAGNANDKRLALAVNNPDYSLSWDAASGISLSSVGGSAWEVDLNGQAAGATTVSFALNLNGKEVYASGPISILVVDNPESVTVPDHYLNLGGAWVHIVEDGNQVASACGRDENPGYVGLDVGELSALYKITLLEDCDKVNLDSTYSYAYRVADPCIARIVAHPVHWGEINVFHVEGLAQGETSLVVYVLKDGVFQFAMPAVAVQVN